MTKAMAQAPVKETVEATLEKMGVSTAGEKATAPDWTKLQDIARTLQSVTVHLIRHEKTSFWNKYTTATDAGTYRNVPIEILISGTAEWIHDQAGGGDYTVEVIHPTDPRMGRLTAFKVSVPGESRKPAPLAAKEAQAMLTSRAQAQGLASKLMDAGMPEAQAYEYATKMTDGNPMAAMFGMGAEDNDMGGMDRLFQMQMMRDMMREERESKEKLALMTLGPQNGAKQVDDARLKALEDRLAEQDRRHAVEKAEWERKEAERRADDRFKALETKFEALMARLDKPAAPAVDPVATALGQVLPAIATMQDQRAADAARSADMQLTILKSTLENAGKKDPALEALLAHMLNTTRLSMEAQQLKLQEPVKQAEAMNSMIGMMAGVMQTTHAIVMQQMQAQQGNPFWDRLAAIADQLPQIILGLANPEVEHGTIESAASDTIDERAASSRVQQMRAADAAVQRAVAAPAEPPPLAASPVEPRLEAPAEPQQAEQQVAAQQQVAEQQETSVDESDESTEDSLPDDPVARAQIILEVFKLEAASVLLEDEEAVQMLDLFWKEGAAPSVLGEKLAKMLLGLEFVVDVKGDDLVRAARDQLGWSPQRAGKFGSAFERTIKSAANAPAAA